MSSDIVISLLISGVRLSALYSLMAIGFTLVYGVGKVFNYSHGAFFTWGAYIAWALHNRFPDLDYPIVFVITIPIMFAFGAAFDKFIITPLRRKPGWRFTVFIVTLAAALFLDSLALVIFGPRYKTLPPLIEGNFNLAGFIIPKHDIALVIIAVSILICLGLFLGRTRQGMAMRAVAQNTVGALIVGIPMTQVFRYTFAISAAFAGISGMLLAPKTLIFPIVGWPILIKSFVIVVFGGLGSVRGTLYAAFILGMTEAMISYYVGGVWALPIFLAILGVVLVFKPQGLFGLAEN